VRDILTDRRNLPVLLGIVALLLALLFLLLFLLWRRGRGEPAEEHVDVFESGGSAAEEPRTIENQVLDRTVGSEPPTTGPLTPGQYPSTEVSPDQMPQAGFPSPWPRPFPQPSFQPQPPGGSPGQTVILQRGGQPQVLALLINRRQPQQRFDLTASNDVGRATANNISLQDATVSRQHAKIKEEKGEFRVFDLGSANGTFVNDARVTDPVVLKDGDIVRFGEVEFLFKRLV
jgi:hypothetical protein